MPHTPPNHSYAQLNKLYALAKTIDLIETARAQRDVSRTSDDSISTIDLTIEHIGEPLLKRMRSTSISNRRLDQLISQIAGLVEDQGSAILQQLSSARQNCSHTSLLLDRAEQLIDQVITRHEIELPGFTKAVARHPFPPRDASTSKMRRAS